MRNVVDRIFVNSAAWVALFSTDDKYYEQAITFWEDLPGARLQPITNHYVLNETYSLLRRRQNGLQRAIAFRRVVEQTGLVEVLEVSSEYRQKGWDIFVSYTDKVISFTDCVCFAMMREMNVYQVFSFDADFARAGFLVRP
jgi:predicted nucleic acid-binding protein